MPKPILTIGLPSGSDVDSLDKIVEKMSDYHVFIWMSEGLIKPEFQVIYEKDFNEMEYKEVVEMINKLSAK